MCGADPAPSKIQIQEENTMNRNTIALSLAGSLAVALASAAMAGPLPAEKLVGKEKCYGISLKGQKRLRRRRRHHLRWHLDEGLRSGRVEGRRQGHLHHDGSGRPQGFARSHVITRAGAAKPRGPGNHPRDDRNVHTRIRSCPPALASV